MEIVQACSGDDPCRISSTMRNEAQALIAASPRPVDPAAPTRLSQYCPAPQIGESPTRPASFQDLPEVVVTDDRSPAALTAFMLIVPWVNLTRSRSASLDVRAGFGRTPTVSSQLSPGLRQAFQRSQSRRLFSVRRFCSLNPIASANFFAPAPTSST